MTERIGFIGGGIFGIALARALAQAGAGDVTVFEKEHRLAAHQAGHNSGVVHAGPYFAEGSLKAQLRVAGGTILLEQEVVAMAVDGGTVRVGTATRCRTPGSRSSACTSPAACTTTCTWVPMPSPPSPVRATAGARSP